MNDINCLKRRKTPPPPQPPPIITIIICRKNQPWTTSIVCQKWKRIENSCKAREDIQSRHRDGIWQRKMQIMKSGKRQMMERMELPNWGKIRTFGEKKTSKYLGIWKRIPSNMRRWKKNKWKKNEYLRRTRKLLETKLHSRNLIKEINTWAVSLVRYSGPFLKWTREELQLIDKRIRKLMTIHITVCARKWRRI